jgi:hypothetical protein
MPCYAMACHGSGGGGLSDCLSCFGAGCGNCSVGTCSIPSALTHGCGARIRAQSAEETLYTATSTAATEREEGQEQERASDRVVVAVAAAVA